MSYIKKDFNVLSSDGIHSLAGVVYLPEGEKKGFFHIAHGMTEYIGRYERIMSDMADEGYICFGYDHLGHGKTANDKSELGFFASKGGYDLLYSYVLDGLFKNYKISISEDAEIESITAIFPNAFLYENEMSELFGIKIKYIALDYKNKLYDIAVETPFK